MWLTENALRYPRSLKIERLARIALTVSFALAILFPAHAEALPAQRAADGKVSSHHEGRSDLEIQRTGRSRSVREWGLLRRWTGYRDVDQPGAAKGFSLFERFGPESTDEERTQWFRQPVERRRRSDLVVRCGRTSLCPAITEGGDSLVSSISVKTPHVLPSPMRAGDRSISPVGSISILTVLAAAPATAAFRPSYCDREQSLFFESAMLRNLLPSLPRSRLAHRPPSLSEFETMFRRPWLDLSPFNFDAPAEYMPQYGAHVATAVSFATLLLTLDFPAREKANLTNYLVQYGIDLFGCVKAGYGWPAHGGHRSGRKAPIIFAGLLLDNSEMKHVSDLYPNRFGEDMQTVYVDKIPGGFTQAWQGAKAIYGGHYGVMDNGQPVSPGINGPHEQLQPKEWPGPLGEGYRRCCTSMSWVGEGLAMRLLGAQAYWNHDAFFDYVDRWMTEDDTQSNKLATSQTGSPVAADWSVQRQTRAYFDGQVSAPNFVDDMWAAFRK